MIISPLNTAKVSYCLSKNIAFKAKKIDCSQTGLNIFVENNALLKPEVLRQKIIRQRFSLLKPIKSEEDYLNLIKKIQGYLLFDYKDNTQNTPSQSDLNYVKNALSIRKLELSDLEYISFEGYENIDSDLKGLVPYCGFADISRQINSWLAARKDSHPTLLSDEQMADVVKAFDYSLTKLDKKYGKFKGLVYRAGKFNPSEDKQYYSASDFLSCAVEHSHRVPPSDNVQYSIIRLKKGHNIKNFQKDTATDISLTFATVEREILIDRKSKFRLVPKALYTKEERMQIRNLIYCTTDKDVNELSKNEKSQIMKNIFVWEEI